MRGLENPINERANGVAAETLITAHYLQRPSPRRDSENKQLMGSVCRQYEGEGITEKTGAGWQKRMGREGRRTNISGTAPIERTNLSNYQITTHRIQILSITLALAQ